MALPCCSVGSYRQYERATVHRQPQSRMKQGGVLLTPDGLPVLLLGAFAVDTTSLCGYCDRRLTRPTDSGSRALFREKIRFWIFFRLFVMPLLSFCTTQIQFEGRAGAHLFPEPVNEYILFT
jgi:hypothetical protein